MQRMESVSPDYIGLLVTFGPNHRRGRTYHYWFKKHLTPTGREVSAHKQLLRKVSSLVFKRLRTGYVVKRKCDPWCRHVVEKSMHRVDVKRAPGKVWTPQKPLNTLFNRPVETDRQQLMFDFGATETRRKKPDRGQLSFNFD